MPRIIIAGVSQGVVSRNPGYTLAIDGWDVIFCHSKKYKSDLRTCWPSVLKLADQPAHGGAHILAFHYSRDDHKEFEAHVYSRHRLVWVDSSVLKDYGTGRFEATVKSLIEFEELWRSSVRPPDVRSPLMLPECSFKPNGLLNQAWKRAQRVVADRDEINSVRALIVRFWHEHYLQRCWIDAYDLRFNYRGARHGVIPAARRWKFAHELPEGFHFDVSADRGRPFLLRDEAGVVRKYTKYANVDCHGHVRGGK